MASPEKTKSGSGKIAEPAKNHMPTYDKDNNLIAKPAPTKKAHSNVPIIALMVLLIGLLMAMGIMFAVQKTTDYITNNFIVTSPTVTVRHLTK